MNEIINNFHFLRPWWLAALPLAIIMTILIIRRQSVQRVWSGVIAEHLLTHLLTGAGQQNKVRPAHLLLIIQVISIIALAGPAWQKEPSPFAEDKAILAIALKVTPSMTAQDIHPSRLERASHKINDLLKLRQGAKTCLIAYSGSAHLVMPLTFDNKIIVSFASELSPDIMPVKGDAAGKAIALASRHLTESGQPGSILLIADSIAANQIKALENHYKNSGIPVHILAVAAEKGVTVPPGSPPAPALNQAALKKAADASGGTLTIVAPDDRDVRKLAGRIETGIAAAKLAQDGQRWQDAGYQLLPLVMLLSLFWFRAGWIVRWE